MKMNQKMQEKLSRNERMNLGDKQMTVLMFLKIISMHAQILFTCQNAKCKYELIRNIFLHALMNVSIINLYQFIYSYSFIHLLTYLDISKRKIIVLINQLISILINQVINKQFNTQSHNFFFSSIILKEKNYFNFKVEKKSCSLQGIVLQILKQAQKNKKEQSLLYKLAKKDKQSIADY
ncbi:hypothetical protein ABPG72_017745 [Tetrahymena utriculariae]